ncbi:hypothetical protein Q7C36_017644 [Tachysurus vachellii]|uniref:Uncharacterized protein n=1 Tax=Tachysurus vachellii TaxID=175792 RepID=A0AA88M3X5_TACVA|nr:hypothetical protein Q7C36_017644 [Tachysurus vachellii]
MGSGWHPGSQLGTCQPVSMDDLAAHQWRSGEECHLPLPAQSPLAGEKNKQPRITPQGLDTKHPQSNLPIS